METQQTHSGFTKTLYFMGIAVGLAAIALRTFDLVNHYTMLFPVAMLKLSMALLALGFVSETDKNTRIYILITVLLVMLGGIDIGYRLKIMKVLRGVMYNAMPFLFVWGVSLLHIKDNAKNAVYAAFVYILVFFITLPFRSDVLTMVTTGILALVLYVIVVWHGSSRENLNSAIIFSLSCMAFFVIFFPPTVFAGAYSRIMTNWLLLDVVVFVIFAVRNLNRLTDK